MRPRALVAAVAVVLAATILALLLLAAPDDGDPGSAASSRASGASGKSDVARAGQSTIFVSPRGDDDSEGSRRKPWRTLRKAASATGPGSTVHVRPGRYAGFELTRSGTRERPIVFTAAPGEGRPVVIGGGDAANVIRLRGSRHVKLAGLSVRGAQAAFGAGVAVESSADISVTRMELRGNRSFGIEVEDSERVSVRGNVITKNETGVQVSRGGRVAISRNRIFRNDRMVVNDQAPDNDRGANAIVLYHAEGPIAVTRNQVFGNRARSIDYGFDGGAFEIYGSSNATIALNRVWDNQNVVETGTSGRQCRNNRFVRNVAYRGSSSKPALGLILRCASGMLVANNTLDGLDRFTFDVTAEARRFGGSVAGLRIANNIAVSDQKLFSIDSALPRSVRIDRNLAFNVSGGSLAYVFERGNTRRLAEFSDWTGFERTGLSRAPGFVDRRAHDYRLARGSPAVGRGVTIAGVADRPRPSLGRYEPRHRR